VIPHGDSYTLSSSATPDAPGTDEEAIEFMRLLARRQLPFVVREGTSSEPRVHVLCGFLGCDVAPFNPVLAALPRRLHVRHPAQPDRLDSLVEFAMSESAQKEAGSDCVLLRLSELMFVEVVRRHLSALPEQAGWLSALRDSVAGRALALLHNDPARAWSLQTLAREAGVSRTLLADRFASTMGQPPMQYLKQWRMQLAAGLLAEGDAKVALVALRVGYESEAAFSRAFKKEVGVPPSLWRNRREPLL
jgi:AraC-like DNA-binding protein